MNGFPKNRFAMLAKATLLSVLVSGGFSSFALAAERDPVADRMTVAQKRSLPETESAANERDSDEAHIQRTVEFLRQAAMQGEPQALLWMGIIYDIGLTVERDLDKAIFWYEKTAEKDFTDAYLPLAFAYGEKGDDARARFWFDKTADIYRDTNCDSELMLVFGAGYVGETIPESQRKARNRINKKRLKWLEGLARRGDKMAALMMASVYREGFGVKKDVRRGDEWCNRANTVDEDGSVIERYCY